MNRGGFILLEAILAIVVVSVCLTLITQALLTNFRTGVRFQEAVRSLMVMQDRLGLLYATGASSDLIDPSPKTLPAPYDKFVMKANSRDINDHLKQVNLRLTWPSEFKGGQLSVGTIVYEQ